jgi:hypothetical protein
MDPHSTWPDSSPTPPLAGTPSPSSPVSAPLRPDSKGGTGRDETGRWQPGTSGNPRGRPRRETEAAYREAILDAVPPERWRKLLEKVAADAEDGNRAALEFLGRHVLPHVLGASDAPKTPDEKVEIEVVFKRPSLLIDAQAELNGKGNGPAMLSHRPEC